MKTNRNKIMNWTTLIASALVFAWLTASAAVGVESPAAASGLVSPTNQDSNELALVQGKWYRTSTEGGKKLLWEKEATGNKEKTTIYSEAGEVLTAYVV